MGGTIRRCTWCGGVIEASYCQAATTCYACHLEACLRRGVQALEDYEAGGTSGIARRSVHGGGVLAVANPPRVCDFARHLSEAEIISISEHEAMVGLDDDMGRWESRTAFCKIIFSR